MDWLSRQKGAARNIENVQEGSREAQRKAGWWGSGDPGVPDVSWQVTRGVWSLLKSAAQVCKAGG